LHIPLLDIGSYYNFLSTTMIVLFVVGLVIVFVYEYEALRRSKS
jgi:heme/copper-type cytochrome/quinol oxidase subunit 2